MVESVIEMAIELISSGSDKKGGCTAPIIGLIMLICLILFFIFSE